VKHLFRLVHGRFAIRIGFKSLLNRLDIVRALYGTAERQYQKSTSERLIEST
jgi:hypothetical protein